MGDKMAAQATDGVNSKGFGTTQLTQTAKYRKANTLNDGGASMKGKREPAMKTGAR